MGLTATCFRHVLNLVPGDVATACFQVTDAAHVSAKGAVIGAMNRETGRFEIDYNRVHELCRQLSVIHPSASTALIATTASGIVPTVPAGSQD